MSEMLVRRMTQGDSERASKALATLKPTGERRGREVAPEGMNAFLADDRNLLLVAEDAGRPIAYLVAYLLDRVDRDVPMVLLYEIEVSPSARRRGVGRRLVDELTRIGREHRVCKIWVLTDRGNEAARRLYRSAGGSEIGANLLIEWAEETG